MDAINVDALFLGPKSENHKFFKEMLAFLMDEHIHWRRDFHPEDRPLITLQEQRHADYEGTLQRTTEALLELSSKLKTSSIPWFSPRYLGHMTADTLMAANLGYMATILYNPNNVAYEGAPATTALELEVGKQFATMVGYDPATAWGHITTDGTVANYEGLWVARNMRSLPLALKAVQPELVRGLDDWQLMNLPTATLLDLLEQAKATGALDAVLQATVRGTGMQGGTVGKLLVPQTKHYSWAKAVDVLGIGQDNLLSIPVQDNYRMDIPSLQATIDRLVREKTPIIGVVAVAGTTEEGAVDEVHEIVRLRHVYAQQGVSFYLHIDAAYGGYARALFLDENDHFMPLGELRQTLHAQGILPLESDWPASAVYNAYKMLSEADSITIDPHKMGYVPYAAGGVVFKDKRVLDLIAYTAAYVGEPGEDDPMRLGSYIMEGSKAGAAAAAVWVAHRVVPLNLTGYGRLIGHSVEGASRFYHSLIAAPDIEVAGRHFTVAPLTTPDLNIVVFAFNEKGNRSLQAMDELNQAIYEHCSYKSGPVYAEDFITSKTALCFATYGHVPQAFVAKLGIPAAEWDKVRRVYVLRSCVLTPYLANATTYDEYWGNFLTAMRKILATVAARVGRPSGVAGREPCGMAPQAHQPWPIIKDGVVYDLLRAEDVEGAARCLAVTFAAGEPMTRSLGITVEELYDFATLVCQKAAREGLSIVAKSQQTGKLMGCLVAEDFVTAPPEGLPGVTPKFAPILALLGELDGYYTQRHTVHKNDILHLFMGGVFEQYTRLNIDKNLIEASEQLGKAKHYKGAIVEATGSISQHIFIEDKKYNMVTSILYKEFEFHQHRIFAGITDCDSCILAYKEL